MSCRPLLRAGGGSGEIMSELAIGILVILGCGLGVAAIFALVFKLLLLMDEH